MANYLMLKVANKEIKFGEQELLLLFNTIINPNADNYEEVAAAANKLCQDLKDNIQALPDSDAKLSLIIDELSYKNIKKILKSVVIGDEPDVEKLVEDRYAEKRKYRKGIASKIGEHTAKAVARFLILFELIAEAAPLPAQDKKEQLTAAILVSFSEIFKKYVLIAQTLEDYQFNESAAIVQDYFIPQFVLYFTDYSMVNFDINSLQELAQFSTEKLNIDLAIDKLFKTLMYHLSVDLNIDQASLDELIRELININILNPGFSINTSIYKNENKQILPLDEYLQIDSGVKDIIEWLSNSDVTNEAKNFDENKIWLYKNLLDKNEQLFALLIKIMPKQELYAFLAVYLPFALAKYMHNGDMIMFAMLQKAFTELNPDDKEQFKLAHVEIRHDIKTLGHVKEQNRRTLEYVINTFFAELLEPLQADPCKLKLDAYVENAPSKSNDNSNIEKSQESGTSEKLDLTDCGEETKTPDFPSQTVAQNVASPANVADWTWQTIDNNHSFFAAIVAQMQLIEHPFLENYNDNNLATNGLLKEYGVFNNHTLLLAPTLLKMLRDFPNLILAIADNNSLEAGFTAHYRLDTDAHTKNTEIEVSNNDIQSILKQKRKYVLRLIQDKDIFASVTSHPALSAGALRAAFNANTAKEVPQPALDSNTANTTELLEKAFNQFSLAKSHSILPDDMLHNVFNNNQSIFTSTLKKRTTGLLTELMPTNQFSLEGSLLINKFHLNMANKFHAAEEEQKPKTADTTPVIEKFSKQFSLVTPRSTRFDDALKTELRANDANESLQAASLIENKEQQKAKDGDAATAIVADAGNKPALLIEYENQKALAKAKDANTVGVTADIGNQPALLIGYEQQKAKNENAAGVPQAEFDQALKQLLEFKKELGKDGFKIILEKLSYRKPS